MSSTVKKARMILMMVSQAVMVKALKMKLKHLNHLCKLRMKNLKMLLIQSMKMC